MSLTCRILGHAWRLRAIDRRTGRTVHACKRCPSLRVIELEDYRRSNDGEAMAFDDEGTLIETSISRGSR